MSTRLRYPSLVASIVVAAGLALWLRLPRGARDTLWAEDGRVFLVGAEHSGFRDLFVPYAGYLQFVPRLIAGGVVALPVSMWAIGMTAGACLVSGLVAGLVFVCAATVIPSPVPRLMLAAVTVLLPLGPRDVFGNPTNIHTVLLWGLFWALFAAPGTRRGVVIVSVAGLLCALSEIQTVVLLPLLLVRALRGRGRLIVVGPAIGIAAQLVATVVSPRRPAGHVPVPLPSLLEGYLVNAVVPLFRPIDGVGPVLPTWGLWAAGALVVLLVGGVVLVWRRLSGWSRVALVGTLVLGPIVYVGSVVVSPAPYYDYASESPTALAHAWLTRYGVAGGMFFTAAVVLVAEAMLRSRPRPGRRAARTPAVVALVAVGLSLTMFFVPSWTRRSDGPEWAPQIAAARTDCATHPGRREVDLRETVRWRVAVECRLLAQRP